nr:unnamed protein product [Digitaria exilis]
MEPEIFRVKHHSSLFPRKYVVAIALAVIVSCSVVINVDASEVTQLHVRTEGVRGLRRRRRGRAPCTAMLTRTPPRRFTSSTRAASRAAPEDRPELVGNADDGDRSMLLL